MSVDLVGQNRSFISRNFLVTIDIITFPEAPADQIHGHFYAKKAGH